MPKYIDHRTNMKKLPPVGGSVESAVADFKKRGGVVTVIESKQEDAIAGVVVTQDYRNHNHYGVLKS